MSKTKAPMRIYLLAVLALAGAGVSAALSQHYYEVRNGVAGFKSFCNLGQQMNCDIVAASPYAELFARLPLSSFAAGWYLLEFAVALAAINAFWRRESMRALFALTGISVVFSLAYFTIMAAVIKTYCLLCLVVDAIDLTTFALVLSLKPEGFKEHKLDVKKWKTFAGIGAAAMLVSVVGLKTMDQLEMSSSDMQELVDKVVNAPVLAVNAGDEFPSFGPKTAPVTIVEFSDFQCPYCRFGAFTINSLLSRYPDKIRVVFRNFPLDPSCNRSVQHTGHQYACEAARTAYCANKQGKFEPLYQDLFENQSKIATGVPAEMAKDVGANPEQLAACVADPATASAISRDVEEGIQLGIQSTPTFFLNGRKMEGAYPAPVWVKIIDKLAATAPASSGG